MGVRPEIIHLPWDQPIVATAVDWLVADAGGDRVDLSETWVLLPTRQAGRRLREALAWACRERGGVFPPRTGTPFQLLNHQETQVAPEVAYRALGATPRGSHCRDVSELIYGVA